MTARYSTLHNGSMAVVSLGMIVVAIVHFMNNPANAPTLSLNDPRFVLFFMLALAMLYYVVLGVSRVRNREPQVVIDHGGIRLGFGRMTTPEEIDRAMTMICEAADRQGAWAA